MIRNHLKAVREALNYTIEDVCRDSGLSRSVVGRIDRNETNMISFDTLDALCRGLNINILDLIEYVPDDEMTPEDIEQMNHRTTFLKRTSRKKEA